MKAMRTPAPIAHLGADCFYVSAERVRNAFLREKGVTLISAGLDEVPMVYKNIHEVMAAQKDLVTILGQFDPKLVKMAPHGERPED